VVSLLLPKKHLVIPGQFQCTGFRSQGDTIQKIRLGAHDNLIQIYGGTGI